jgi:uncharacterized membrane protein
MGRVSLRGDPRRAAAAEARARLGGLGVLALAVGKVFLVDLAHPDSMWRVGSFLAVGLLLLAGAFAYQRARVPLVRECRETRGAV